MILSQTAISHHAERVWKRDGLSVFASAQPWATGRNGSISVGRDRQKTAKSWSSLFGGQTFKI